MDFSESFAVALRSLLANRIRLVLTMLGIIIGVGAVITMISLGNGAKQAVETQIQQLGTNILTVRPGAQGPNMNRAAGNTVEFKLEHVEAVRQQCKSLEAVVPEYYSNTQVKYGNQVMYSQICGTEPAYEWVRNSPVVQGEYFTNSDNSRRSRVCVVGQKVKETLFPNSDNVIGEQIKIKGVNFTIVGVLKSKGEGWGDPDNTVIVPILTAQKRLFGTERVSQISIKVPDVAAMDPAALEVEGVLRKYLKLRPDEENNFSIRSQLDMLSTFGEASKTLTTLLASIAAVSLLVGGIGIMNIMLVSVTERTREIGIRIAIGARKRDIRYQFLIEAVVIASIGGLIGIIMGIGASFALATFAAWNTSIAPNSIVLSFFFAFFVGVVFGLFPAVKASNLNPIESLRYE
ncbi:MAG: ABC transporter permease [Candidatus Zixiibacteriota bacterium]